MKAYNGKYVIINGVVSYYSPSISDNYLGSILPMVRHKFLVGGFMVIDGNILRSTGTIDMALEYYIGNKKYLNKLKTNCLTVGARDEYQMVEDYFEGRINSQVMKSLREVFSE